MAEALGGTGSADAVEPLLAVQQNDGESPRIRQEAAAALCRLWDARAIPPHLNDPVALATRILINQKGSSNPLVTLRVTSRTLANFGLIAPAEAGGTGGYRLTDDGLLYVDGMFLPRRVCSEHPSSTDDLNAVSRGRMMILNRHELMALAAIFLGESIVVGVLECAARSGEFEWVGAALTCVAGPCAHGIRHSHRPGPWGMPPDLGEKGEAVYRRQLAVTIEDLNEAPRKLLLAVLASDVLGPMLGGTGRRLHRHAQ